MEQKQNMSKITTASLMIALGIIYGDIGTSPLYALRAVIGERPISEILVYGGVSCIFWTLFFQTTVKYVFLTLTADNQGEGGVFSLYALIRRYGKYLAVPTILGATTLLADGIITPPISVASAIEGLNCVPGMEHIIVPGNALTIGIVVVIMSGLFFFQRYGTQSIGKAFGPIMSIWFSVMLFFGLYEVSRYPGVMAALNPYYAYQFLAHYPKGFWLLGAVFLCTTGAEALYSDLGHCGIKNIRLTWIFVKASLVLNYLGQAAYVIHLRTPTLQGGNPFFDMLPHWFLLPGIIIATFATIIASQALISGSFTLISEAMNLNFWPRVKVHQPTDFKGQIYIPSVNSILWFGCVLMILYFKTSSAMEAAYGFSITVAMLMTTYLLGFFLLYKKKWNKYLVYSILSVFLIIELSFFVANVAKIKERWMFLFFELFIFMTMYIWYNARKTNNRFMKFVEIGKFTALIKDLSQDLNIPKYSTHLIYLSKANNKAQIEEKIMKSIFAKKPKRADVYWFLHINRTEEPYTMTYDVNELVDDKVVKVNINVGFRIQPKTELYFKKIMKELIENKELSLHERSDGSTKYNTEPDFKFIMVEKYFSIENELPMRDVFMLKSFFILKNMGLSDIKAFGLDKSDVEIEQIPLVYQLPSNVELTRVK
jgi:KUP system potassium uptake protein